MDKNTCRGIFQERSDAHALERRDDMSDSHDGLSYLLKIKLATDFGKVSDVRVIARNGQQEQKELENKAVK